jgi:hypothetical protein
MHSASLAFAFAEVRRTRCRAERAIEQREQLSEIPSRHVQMLAQHNCDIALQAYRAAIGKRNFEIRQLQNS